MRPLYLFHRLLQRTTAGRARIVPYLFFAQPVPGAPSAPVRGKARTVCQARARACLPADLPRPEAVIEQRFLAGSRCLFVAKDEALAGFLWIHDGPYLEDEVRAVFAPEPPSATAWDFDVYVAPSYRLSRTFARLWDAANEDLRTRGVRWCHSRISAFNANSISVHRKLGAQQVGWAGFLCLGPVQLMISSLRPWLHLSLRRAPVLAIPSPDS